MLRGTKNKKLDMLRTSGNGSEEACQHSHAGPVCVSVCVCVSICVLCIYLCVKVVCIPVWSVSMSVCQWLRRR